MIASVPTSFNPSDYEYLIKSVVEGNIVSKIQSLKRLNTLVSTDKKQFSIYAKRIVIAIQDLITEEKEDVNLIASTLALEIINLNPRDIEYYIRTKLLKNMVKNLGDAKPQIRKTSHYCLLAYVKTYKTFDEVIQIYVYFGFNSESWQLRQKSINSFQSILIMEMKYLNWSSPEFRKVVDELLGKTKDQSQNVQKAAELCLISICKNDEFRAFSKKLPNTLYSSLKIFVESMFAQGFLTEIKLYIPDTPQGLTKNFSQQNILASEHRTLENVKSVNSFEKNQGKTLEHSTPKQNLIQRIEEIRKKAQTPVKQKFENMDKTQKLQEQSNRSSKMKKTQSFSIVSKKIPKQAPDLALPSIRKSINLDKKKQGESKTNIKTENLLGRKLIDDLKNEKDWKVRLEAIEELQGKFSLCTDQAELDSMAKSFLQILIKLLADANFKIALIALKIIEIILDCEGISYASLIPQLVEKISDGKVALRQNISKLIRKEFIRTSNKLWISQLMQQLKKSPPPNSNVKEQILNILSKITIESRENQKNHRMISAISSSIELIIESICPLMDDLKTKIKIKTLDLLILLSIKTEKIETIKSILAARLNQVYFEMYVEKISKEMKAHGLEEQERGPTSVGRREKTLGINSRRYNNKNSGNTTSTSLKKHVSVDEHNTTARTASFIETKTENNAKKEKNFDEISISDMKRDNSSPSKLVIKSYRKKNVDYKSTQYSAFSTEPALPPYSDPEKELKMILTEIRSDEWQACTEALSKLRRIIENHSELLEASIVRLLSVDIMRQVESLRSNLSKNAVITLHDLSNKVKKMLDPDLDSIFSKLLKKTLDANSFISEEVRRALVSICSNCNESRVLTLLVNSHSSKAVPLKLTIVYILENITFLPRVYERQLERVVSILVNLLSQGSLQIREKSKALLSNVLCSERGSQISKLVPNEHLSKLKLNVIKNQAKESSTIINDAPKSEDGQSSSIKKKKKQKITIFPAQFDNLEELLEQSESNDWKMREKNMKSIFATMIEPYPRELSQHRLATKIMDILGKQIGDPNVKVATNALKILQWMSVKNTDLIQSNISVLMNEIFNCFGSHKVDIRTLAEELFESISESIQNWMLLQHMSNGALYGVQKSRPIILKKIAEILPNVFSSNKKSIINKNVYPMINKLSEENKPENYDGLGQIMQVCQSKTDGEFQTYLKPKAIQLFNSFQTY